MEFNFTEVNWARRDSSSSEASSIPDDENIKKVVEKFAANPSDVVVLETMARLVDSRAQELDKVLCKQFAFKKLLRLVESSDSEVVSELAEKVFNDCMSSRDRIADCGLTHTLNAKDRDALDKSIKLQVCTHPDMREWFFEVAATASVHTPAPAYPIYPICEVTSENHPGLLLDIRMPTDKERNCTPIPSIMWAGSNILARLLLSVPELVEGKKVLEIGAGFHCVPAAAASRSGAGSVLTTDVDSVAVRLSQLNVAHNDIARTTSERLDWLSIEDYDLGQFDVIIGAEIVHEDWMAKAVEKVIAHYLAPGGVRHKIF